MNDLVSVIVPVYNVEKYLRQCLESLLAQNYKNLEVIMIDDGSKDSSGEICEEYRGIYNNFYVIHKQNEGLGMARNTGLEYIHGDYVMFMDSDDYLDSDFIEILYENLLKNNVDMCKGGFKRVADSGKIITTRQYDNEVFYRDEARINMLPRMIGSSPSKHDSIEMCVCGAIYKADLIKKNNLKFPSERELVSEDLVFNIDYMQYANGACTIDSVGYNYRVNLNSLTTSYRIDRFDASKHFYIEMKRKLQKLGYENETMLRLDRMFFIYMRMCIGQEKISHNQMKDSVRIINKICNDNTVRNVIQNYPYNKLGIKQKMFLWLIENKKAVILYLACKIKRL